MTITDTLTYLVKSKIKTVSYRKKFRHREHVPSHSWHQKCFKDHLPTGPYGWFCWVTKAGRRTSGSLSTPILPFTEIWRNVTEKEHYDVLLKKFPLEETISMMKFKRSCIEEDIMMQKNCWKIFVRPLRLKSYKIFYSDLSVQICAGYLYTYIFKYKRTCDD